MKTITILLASLSLFINAFSQKLVKTYWDYSNTKLQTEYYTDAYGTKNGSFKGYSEYGGILLQGVFKNGAPIGKWIENYSDGKLHYIKIYDTPGYANLYVKDGKIISYYENGKTMKYEKNFKNGELDGDYKEYDESGTLIKEGKYVNGIFEITGESKRIYDEEQEKQKQLKNEQVAATQIKNSEEYKNIIPEADKAFVDKDFKKALQLYKSASDLMSNEKYPKDKIAEIIKLFHSNSAFFLKYTNSQYDSLDLDKRYFNSKIALKTYGYDITYVTDKNGTPKALNKGSDYQGKFNFEKPWENDNWERVKSCFDRNKGVYNPIQIAITEQYFNYISLLEKEESSIKNTSYSFNYESINNSFYTYDKATFLNNLSAGKMKYNLAKSLVDLQTKSVDKQTQIESLNNQNKKKTLFSKYQIVYIDFNVALQSFTEPQSLASILTKLNIFLDKVISLYTQDTKELEKQLKDVETADQIKSIILGQ
jgi:antitoxin component YwqK of YwqJK toxin-antitoxin module